MHHKLRRQRGIAIWKIDGEGGTGSQAAFAAVSHHPNYLCFAVALPFPENRVSANRIFVGEDQLCQLLADHHVSLRGRLVALSPDPMISGVERAVARRNRLTFRYRLLP